MTFKELRAYTSQLTPYQLDKIKVQILRYLALNEELEDTTPECCPFCKDAASIIKKGKPMVNRCTSAKPVADASAMMPSRLQLTHSSPESPG